MTCCLRSPSLQVVVPRTYAEYTSRRVLTTQWLEGEKLSQSQADDVGRLVNVSTAAALENSGQPQLAQLALHTWLLKAHKSAALCPAHTC